MGELKVIKLTSKKDKADYIHQLVKDVEALDKMIKDDIVEKTPIRIGAEQEFCLVNNEFNPSHKALDVLQELDDDHFTTEIGDYNLEANLDPLELKGECFSLLRSQLKSLLDKANLAATKHDSKVLLTGILPTLSTKHIGVENMTPIQRYQVLNEAIRESRKQDFEIHIKGVDEVNFLHDSVMLEGCNTSFQIHLQINPNNFIESYNWAQAISGPILSICTNSPILFGNELWSETRIALFTQSVDTRANSFTLNEKQSRVSFGSEWTSGSVTDIFKDNISRFRSLVTSEFIKDSVEMLKDGEIPKLKALNLHNGTVYRWNRACYGVGEGRPHLRIENRYIPSGPTIEDEIANTVLWVGVMIGQSREYKKISQKMNFKDAKANFFNAARYGMGAQFKWNNNYISSQDLLLNKLLPMAYRGLYSAGVSPKDVEYYLGIIEKRINAHTGSEWMVNSYRNLLKNKNKFEAIQTLTSYMYRKQQNNYPVSSWRILGSNEKATIKIKRSVKHKMSTDIFSVAENDSLELVKNIMVWKNIRHMPVINDNKKLVGLLSRSDIEKLDGDETKLQQAVGNIMTKKIFTIGQFESIEKAKEMMKEKEINCLPVVKERTLIGILTSTDLLN